MSNENNNDNKINGGFDLEDYATTYKATRDAYLTALNDVVLATGPYLAARDAYSIASIEFIKSTYKTENIEDDEKKICDLLKEKNTKNQTQ